MIRNLIILLLLINTRSFAQLPDNIGFEDGSLNHWNCAAGTIDSTGLITLRATNPLPTRHVLLSRQKDGNTRDPYGNFPVVCPNGSNYSIRLGNDSVHHQAESISYTFVVPTDASYSITFNYAVVFQNPDHKYYQQPKFTARFFNVTDNEYISCPSFNFVASSALPGFTLSSTKAAGGAANTRNTTAIYYKDWSTATLNIHGYLGKRLRLEFTTNDCTMEQHFGYAYIDVDEGMSASPITGNTYCSSQKQVTLKGPPGYDSYIWYNEDMSAVLGTEQSLDLSPPPPDLTKYALRLFPYPDVGCPDTIYTTVKKLEDGINLKVADTVYGCPESGANIAAASVTEGSSPGLKYSYYLDASQHDHVRDSTAVVIPGSYYIVGTNAEGCSVAQLVHVKLVAPVITITQPEPTRYPATIDLSKTFVKQPGQIYSYFKDASAAVPLDNYTSINTSGRYFVKVMNTYGCEQVVPVDATLLPPLPFVVSAPNVFTPNNDGVNDLFNLHLEGYIQFNNIDIFNRYGQLIYSNKINAFWDGTYKGGDLPVGTYYWVFNGLDTYYHNKVTRNGSIAIIR